MKSLQARYSALQGFNFVATCTSCAFVAIYLQSRGLGNTLVGVTTAAGCIVNIFLGTALSNAIARIEGLTIARVLDIAFAVMAVAFLAIAFLPVPAVVIMVEYALMYGMLMSTPPLISQIAMDYIRQRKSLNFGFARGIGSISYAITAIVVSNLVELFGANAIPAFFAFASVVTIALVHALPVYEDEPAQAKSAVEPAADAPAEKPLGMGAFIKRYRSVFMVNLGFCLCFIGATCVTTYLPNIVTSHGGSTAVFGIATFAMAASELPAMTIMPRLRKKIGTGALFALAGVAYVLRNGLIVVAPSLPVLFMGLVFQSMSYGILTPLIAYFVSEVCGTRDEITGQMLMAVMTTGIGAATGNLLGGVLQDSLGMGAMFALAMVATVVGAAVLISTGLKLRKESELKAA